MCIPPSAPKDQKLQVVESSNAKTSKSLSSSSYSYLSSYWSNAVEERKLKIAKLNERVTVLTARAVAAATATANQNGTTTTTTTKLAPEFVYAQQKMTVLTAGAPIYQLRCAPLTYLYACLAACLIVYGTSLLPWSVALISVVTMFLGYDIYSGVLHVVFDHPDNIALPLLGQPCLEFQWHHSIPDDLVRKDFVDVCGDLNAVVAILIAFNLSLLPLDNGVAMLLGGMKLFMAYYGQFSHRSAHSAGKSLSPVAKWLQLNKLMVSNKAHMSHHLPPHEVDYCLVGPGNGLIDAMRKVTHNNAAWLTLFFIWSFFDIYIFMHLVEKTTAFIV